MEQEVLCCIGDWEVLKPETPFTQPKYRMKGTTEITDSKPKSVEMIEQDEGTWEQVRTPNGMIKRHLVTQSVRIPQGEDLPEGWVQRQSPDGRVFYKNILTNEKSWTKPQAQPSRDSNAATIDEAFGSSGAMMRQGSASPELVASPDSLLLGTRVAKLSPQLGTRTQLPEESPSRGTVPAFVGTVSPNKNLDGYLTQIELLSAERNIESELRKKQEAKNMELQDMILHQQEKLAEMEKRTTFLKANQHQHQQQPQFHQQRVLSDKKSRNSQLRTPQRQQQQQQIRESSMSPHQALAVAQDIYDNSGINGIIKTPGSDPRELATHLLSSYVKNYGGDRQVVQKSTVARKKVNQQINNKSDQDMVLNLNISDEHGTLQAVPADGSSENVVGVSLNVFHDGNGELLGVQPSSQGIPPYFQQQQQRMPNHQSKHSRQWRSSGMGKAPGKKKRSKVGDTLEPSHAEVVLREELVSQRSVIETQQNQLIDLQKQILNMMKEQDEKIHSRKANESTEQIISHKVYNTATPEVDLKQKPLDLVTFDQIDRESKASSTHSLKLEQPQVIQSPVSPQKPVGVMSSPVASGRRHIMPNHIGGPSAPPPYDSNADPRQMCPISEFRQYEMADTLARLQTLSETRPAQGIPPVMVTLPHSSPNLQQHPADSLPDTFYTQQSAGVGASSRVPHPGEQTMRSRRSSIAL